MGVLGNFWDALKPYARYEGFDFMRNKKVAVDLSLWIVQHETALKFSRVRNPHLRLTFFRTINLFSKFGAYPIFVVDGKPSHLKSKARIARFFRSSGIDPKDMPAVEEGVSVDRNKYFVKCVEECVDLLKHLGMPFIRARGEAEALCAQLNSEGVVDACITSDSDAFLFGAKCVIKHVDPKSTRPFECYYVEDIEAGLRLGRKHLIAVSLLVGSDHNLNGVQGIGMETALRFVKKYNEDEVLQRLNEIGSGPMFPSDANFGSSGMCTKNSDMFLQKSKAPHCSFCGHPGNKSLHRRVPCEYCHSTTGVNCSKKPPKFKCVCSGCDRDRKGKELKKDENFHLRVCKKIAMECNFPCNEIIEIYLRNEDSAEYSARLLWKEPDIEMLIDFLAYHLHWEPSYIRQQIFPMLSTIFLRDMALNPSKLLLHGQYKFDSIQRLKTRYDHQFYVVMWRRSSSSISDANFSVPSEGFSIVFASESEESQIDVTGNGLDELNVPQIHVDGECSYILTDENLELVQAAFPAEVDSFLQQKEVKRSRRKVSKLGRICIESPSLNSGGVQLAITDYYRSNKQLDQAKDNHKLAQNEEIGSLKEKRKASSPSLSKSHKEVALILRIEEKDGSELQSSSENTLALLLDNNYRVVTAFSGADALDTLQKKKRKVDLVLMSSKLPDMCAVEVLDILEFKYNMAVVMVFDTYQPNAMMEFLQNGAMFCVMKPLSSRVVAKLWHHSIVKETELLRKSTKSPTSGVTFKESEIHVADPSSFTWTPSLEEKFLRIICTLGVYDAAPIEILRHMNVPGLTINLVLTKLQECQEKQNLQFNSIRVSPTAYIIAQNAHNQLMGQNIYANPGQAFANEQGYPVSGFLLNPHEDELNRARAYDMLTPPTVSVLSFALGLNMFQLPQAPVPPANTAQRLIQPPWSSTHTDLPSSSTASSAPGDGEDDYERGK